MYYAATSGTFNTIKNLEDVANVQSEPPLPNEKRAPLGALLCITIRHCEERSDDKFAGSEFGRTQCARRAGDSMSPVNQSMDRFAALAMTEIN